MKLLKKFFANIKNLNKLIQIVLTFCLCFVITFFLTLIFNNKFKFIEKFTHSSCKYIIYWFHGDVNSGDNKIFKSKWKKLTGNDSLIQNLPICYIKAPKKENHQDKTYSDFLKLYPYLKTAGNILLVLGKNLSDSTNQQTDSTNQQRNQVRDITYIKRFTDKKISYEINNLISNFYDINNNS